MQRANNSQGNFGKKMEVGEAFELSLAGAVISGILLVTGTITTLLR